MSAALLGRQLFLGLLQGLTEFLPVSSSGHLALVLHLTGWDERRILPAVVLLHLATTLAVTVYFRREIAAMIRGFLQPSLPSSSPRRRLLYLIAAGSVPTAAIGLAFRDALEGLFSSPPSVAAGLLLTGLVLWASEAATRRPRAPRENTFAKAAAIGVAQGIAIAPGVSRSGATIGAGLLLGVGRAEAFTFSFLLSIPANLGAIILEAGELGKLPIDDIMSAAIGMAAAFLSGYAALALLSRRVREGRLFPFSLYCWFLAAVILAIL